MNVFVKGSVTSNPETQAKTLPQKVFLWPLSPLLLSLEAEVDGRLLGCVVPKMNCL